MVLFNYALKALTAKIVYYGPGLSGKTTNLQYIYEELPIKNKGRMLTLATETDRTLYFDFLPVDAGVVRGIKTRVQLYTVPGQVFYNATRRMVGGSWQARGASADWWGRAGRCGCSTTS